MTFLGGGGITLPGTTTSFGGIGAGGAGGLSRTTNGAGAKRLHLKILVNLKHFLSQNINFKKQVNIKLFQLS